MEKKTIPAPTRAPQTGGYIYHLFRQIPILAHVHNVAERPREESEERETDGKPGRQREERSHLRACSSPRIRTYLLAHVHTPQRLSLKAYTTSSYTHLFTCSSTVASRGEVTW